MDILVTLIVGGVIGWLASLLMKTNAQMGILANVVVGIVGSFVGRFVFGALGLVAYGSVGRIVTSVAGAALLIAVLKGLKVYR
jgi:uncharacterized membrane protein YeaQ/YmgE (transglycosylase-associated protein family)